MTKTKDKHHSPGKIPQKAQSAYRPTKKNCLTHIQNSILSTFAIILLMEDV